MDRCTCFRLQMERGMDSFCFFNLRDRTTYYLAYNCWGSISNEDKGASDLAAATNNFSLANKIGHGGSFGNVYKGVLKNGVEIAVKKQDMISCQGFTEFKNEFKLIAKLQHRNLTKLLGYCINGAEKLLVYEFMANNSLDKPQKTEIWEYPSEIE
ncbi:hypothetical protein KY290_003467 [Solanum tuberosum]|uniref:Protein kinase domain-containing protein n=1 Tax=Solanum tuberosum TaxID=4113 RepID=A0ABQ7WV88_SOLTU|nr:hypothetical protein KY290_003467 [Solanum tuberosum]